MNKHRAATFSFDIIVADTEDEYLNNYIDEALAEAVKNAVNSIVNQVYGVGWTEHIEKSTAEYTEEEMQEIVEG